MRKSQKIVIIPRVSVAGFDDIEPVRVTAAELLPPEPPKPDADFSDRLVHQKAAEIIANREDLLFRPFFDTQRVSAELRRFQTMPARRKWAQYFEQFGCLICRTKKALHGGCGGCSRCYYRTAFRLTTILVGRPASPTRRFHGDRFQTMPARRKWAIYFEIHSCLICETKCASYMGLGLCAVCYTRTALRLRSIIGETAHPRPRQRLNGDLAAIARKALLDAVNTLSPTNEGRQ
ncbi:MAG: hypothetical protein WBD87_08825 [Candidatus Acidiferrales bacterium]